MSSACNQILAWSALAVATSTRLTLVYVVDRRQMSIVRLLLQHPKLTDFGACLWSLQNAIRGFLCMPLIGNSLPSFHLLLAFLNHLQVLRHPLCPQSMVCTLAISTLNGYAV